MNKIKALYIHIPFCSSICSYCDFYKMVAKEEVKTKYVDYLVKELEMKKSTLQDITTIYIGGGTPSNLNYHLLDFLLFHINKIIDMNKVEEFSIEANPNDITLELVNIFNKYHINRVSLGVQSFNPEKLKVLNRKHNAKDVKKAMNLLKQNGLTNINVDLIFGLKNDSYITIKNDLNKAIKYGATHLSTYSLIVEERTILYKLVNNGEVEIMDEDIESNIYGKIRSFLKKKGFVHYEISNFSRKNYQCKHNLVYWDNMNYIGVGAGASYYIGNTRYTNIKNLESYFNGIDLGRLNYSEVTILSQKEIMGEEMMLGLRKISGINLVDFKNKFGIDVYSAFPIIRKLLDLQLLSVNGDYLLIPEKKLYLSNEVLVNFI